MSTGAATRRRPGARCRAGRGESKSRPQAAAGRLFAVPGGGRPSERTSGRGGTPEQLGDTPRLPRTAARRERRLRLEELRDGARRIRVEGVEVASELGAGGVHAPYTA